MIAWLEAHYPLPNMIESSNFTYTRSIEYFNHGRTLLISSNWYLKCPLLTMLDSNEFRLTPRTITYMEPRHGTIHEMRWRQKLWLFLYRKYSFDDIKTLSVFFSNIVELKLNLFRWHVQKNRENVSIINNYSEDALSYRCRISKSWFYSCKAGPDSGLCNCAHIHVIWSCTLINKFCFGTDEPSLMNHPLCALWEVVQETVWAIFSWYFMFMFCILSASYSYVINWLMATFFRL